jgi:protein TonB
VIRVTFPRWLVAGLVVACMEAAAITPVASGWQAVPRRTGRVGATEAGPLEQIAVTPSLDVPAPRRTRHVAPEWPTSVAGGPRSLVHLVIDAAGNVAEARVVHGSAAEGTDGPAEVAAVLAAVRQWTFEPPARAPMLLVTYIDGSGAEGVVVPSSMARRPVRIGKGMRPPAKVHHVNPEYPSDAGNAGISGVVILEATVDPEGAVTAVQVVRSVPALDEAAMAAVRQWRYAPTWLNGEAIPVIMTVTVNFQP